MTGTIVIINLAGAVAMLLWAARMVRTGVERAYGDSLKAKLKLATGNRVAAAVAGMLLAVALQSATAVALIVSGFASSGYVSASIGIATLLGADFGSAFVVRLLRHDLSLLIPLLLLAGTVAFRATEARAWRQAGRIMFGLGLLLLSLRLIGEASEPLKESALLPIIIRYLSGDWVTAFVVAGIIAWLFHSSVATILLFASLCDRGLIPDVLIVPLVLGANFGAAVIAAVLTRGEAPAARIIPMGNVLIRGAGMLVLLVIHIVRPFPVELIEAGTGDRVVLIHLAANGLVLIFGILFVNTAAKFLARTFLPKTPEPESAYDGRLSVLNPAALTDPRQAANNVQREVIALCEKTELMLSQALGSFESGSDEDIARLEMLDDQIDNMNREIKFYLARISESALDEKSANRCNELLGVTIKLEQAADVISQNMLTRARKKKSRDVKFSPQGWKELTELHAEVLQNARQAFNLLINPDVEYARQLAARKEVVRKMVQSSEEMHLKRLREGNVASFESSSIHIDVMRDLKEINSLIVSLAYPALSKAGMLRESRLL